MDGSCNVCGMQPAACECEAVLGKLKSGGMITLKPGQRVVQIPDPRFDGLKKYHKDELERLRKNYEAACKPHIAALAEISSIQSAPTIIIEG